MAVTTAADLVAALRSLPLLGPGQLQEVVKLQPRYPEPKALAHKLLKRGWLTAYQLNQLLQGKGQELVLDQYVLLDRLGEGGMGQVFKARHLKLDRIVALKVMRQEQLAKPTAVKRFHREVQAAAQLTHPNIVLGFDAGQVGATHFFVMEYVDGTDFRRMVKQRGPLPVAQACDYIRQAALGLQHAHERGLIHRDIKPSNLLITSAGPGADASHSRPSSSQPLAPYGTVKILDMGLARLSWLDDEDSGSVLTRDGVMLGTVEYLAPEQAFNAHSVDIRADIYSLGCTFYFLLTGRVPFPEGGMTEKVLQHRVAEPTPVEQFRQDVPPNVIAVVKRMMAKRPEDRFQTPSEVAAALAAPALGAIPLPVAAIPVATPAARQAAAPAGPIKYSPEGIPLAIPVGLPPSKRAGSTMRISAASLLPKVSLPRPSQRWLWIALAAAMAMAFLAACGLWILLPSDKEMTNTIGMRLVLVPPGKFTMGSPKTEDGRNKDEGPHHEVAITQPFYLGAYPVTVRQFRTFVDATNYKTEAETSGVGAFAMAADGSWQPDPNCNWRNPGWQQTDNQPVVCVSWNDALAFCTWLAKKESKVYRLPTEAEWEYACRAGTVTPYHFGKSVTREQANFAEGPLDPSRNKTTRVGSYPANAFGLYDMHGNIWQWCADWYEADYYGKSPQKDPPGPSSGNTRTCRGGSFASSPAELRSAQRFNVPPTGAWSMQGFRVALAAPPKGG
jgi:formylglycine-generating enzyme required for sulfatase activity/tRNA A-37 threonylcarbamoyl transferase component Bud32